MIKLNVDGKLDRSFSGNGIKVLPDFDDVAPNGTDFLACQINQGKFDGLGRAVVLAMCFAKSEGDDRVHVDGIVSRYLPDGRLDPAFNDGEPVYLPGVRSQFHWWGGFSFGPDGSIFVGSHTGSTTYLSKLDPFGALVEDFGTDGTKSMPGALNSESVGASSLSFLYFANWNLGQSRKDRFRVTSLTPLGQPNSAFGG